MQNVSSEHHVHIGEALFYTFRDVLLLNHAAAHSDEHVRLELFVVLERAEISEHPVLGVFTNRAGIEKHEVGSVGGIRESVSHHREHALYLLAVADVLLAAEAVDVGYRRQLPGGIEFTHLFSIFLLCRSFRGSYFCRHVSVPLYFLR